MTRRKVGSGRLSDRKLAQDPAGHVVSTPDIPEKIQVISWRELPFCEMTEREVDVWFTEYISLLMVDCGEVWH